MRLRCRWPRCGVSRLHVDVPRRGGWRRASRPLIASAATASWKVRSSASFPSTATATATRRRRVASGSSRPTRRQGRGSACSTRSRLSCELVAVPSGTAMRCRHVRLTAGRGPEHAAVTFRHDPSVRVRDDFLLAAGSSLARAALRQPCATFACHVNQPHRHHGYVAGGLSGKERRRPAGVRPHRACPTFRSGSGYPDGAEGRGRKPAGFAGPIAVAFGMQRASPAVRPASEWWRLHIDKRATISTTRKVGLAVEGTGPRAIESR